MRLPEKDSATGRGLKTSVFAFLGSLITILISLWTVLRGVPGCSEAIIQFVQANAITIASTFGISAGSVSFLFNLFFRRDVKNY